MKRIISFIAILFLAFPIASNAQKTTVTSVNRTKTYQKTTKNISIWYQGEYNIGFATGSKCVLSGDGYSDSFKTNFMRPFLETVQGFRVTNYAFAGVGVGFQYAPGQMYLGDEDYIDYENWNTLLMPLYVNLKGYYPVTESLAPFVSLSFGGSFCFASTLNDYDEDVRLKGGYYGEYGVGVKYNKYQLSLGLQTVNCKLADIDYDDSYIGMKFKNTFFLKLGLVF